MWLNYRSSAAQAAVASSFDDQKQYSGPVALYSCSGGGEECSEHCHSAVYACCMQQSSRASSLLMREHVRGRALPIREVHTAYRDFGSLHCIMHVAACSHSRSHLAAQTLQCTHMHATAHIHRSSTIHHAHCTCVCSVYSRT
jgi:hypothetical protein